MGFLDALLGKRKISGPAPDRLFALTTAYVDLAAGQGITTRGAAGIVFQNIATADFAQILSDTQELLKRTGAETGSTIETKDDAYGYKWIVVRDDDLEDIVVSLNAVADNLSVGGYGARTLPAVSPLPDEAGKPIYLIYSYKRGTWYPFVPAPGDQQRNPERELQLQ